MDLLPDDGPTGLEPPLDPSGMLATRVERAELGRSRRSIAPRSSFGAFTPSPTRRDPLAVLGDQNARRYQDLVALRWGRMVASPFTYFRGSAAVMAADLADTPRTGLTVQACGDAHCANFGLFASPERHLLFDLNDFDETLPGPWEWDVERLAVSLILAARDRAMSEAEADEAVDRCLEAYRVAMGDYAGMSQLDVWYAKVDVDDEITFASPDEHGPAASVARRARRRTALQAVNKLTTVVDGRRRIVDDPPIVEHIPDLATVHAIRTLLDRYASSLAEDRRTLLDRFEVIDVARKVVGVGSVGTHCWIALLTADADDSTPLLLQVKEANRSVLEPWIGASLHRNHGERVVVGQRLMQAASDIFLGWTNFKERHYYVRQLRDMKGSIDLDHIDAPQLALYGAACGQTLARAHARTGDPVAIAAYLGASNKFDRAMRAFAHSYADLMERDHARLRAAVDGGTLPALEGV